MSDELISDNGINFLGTIKSYVRMWIERLDASEWQT